MLYIRIYHCLLTYLIPTMPSRSARDSRYDDPYVFDDPYKSSSPPHNAYEYVGTDDPSGYPEHRQRPRSPVEEPRRRSSPSRRHARTTSPPRHSRRGRDQTPPPAYASPPRHRNSRRTSPPPRASKEALPHSKPKVHQNKYKEFAQRPGVQRAQTIGKKGLGLIGEAAAAYYASQSPQDQRAQSAGREPPSNRDNDRARRHRARREDSYYDSDGPPQRSHHHRRRHSPSPSPSPPPRRRKSERHSRRRDHSEAPSVSSRDYSRDRGRHRDDERSRRHRRAYSYSPSPPPPSSRRDRSSRHKSADYAGSTRSAATHNVKSDEANARWQMAIRAALEAGGLAALRMRKQPGSWTGDKGARVAKAALGAAAMDALVEVRSNFVLLFEIPLGHCAVVFL